MHDVPRWHNVRLVDESGKVIQAELGEYRVVGQRLIINSTREYGRHIENLTQEFIVVKEES